MGKICINTQLQSKADMIKIVINCRSKIFIPITNHPLQLQFFPRTYTPILKFPFTQNNKTPQQHSPASTSASSTGNPQKNYSFWSRRDRVKGTERPLASKYRLPPEQGYGYYNWQAQDCCTRVLQDKYYLNDVIIGFRNLKNRVGEGQDYTEKQMTFMAYILVLFPMFEEEILPVFLPAFIKDQENGGLYRKQCQYIQFVKLICYEGNRRKDSYTSEQNKIEPSRIFESYLRRRINLQQNLSSLQSILQSINQNCYDNMDSLFLVFESFKDKFFKSLKQQNYSIDFETMKTVVQIFLKLSMFDSNIKHNNLLSEVPKEVFQVREYLRNFLTILPDLLSFNFAIFINDRDLEDFNRKLNDCVELAKDKEIRKLIWIYSEHLITINKVECINFQDVLDPI